MAAKLMTLYRSSDPAHPKDADVDRDELRRCDIHDKVLVLFQAAWGLSRDPSYTGSKADQIKRTQDALALLDRARGQVSDGLSAMQK